MGGPKDEKEHGSSKKEETNRCLSLKTRNFEKTEVMFYLKFEKPYASHSELLTAISFILQENIGWSSPQKAMDLLVDSNLH
jgi:hypothetical protein